MDDNLFERLLFEEEGPTLDFKKEQYRFVKASDDEKSELLKDILGFSNAWRRGEAYILIGVEENRVRPKTVCGIAPSDQLQDHALQQFVNNLTNRPVVFRYQAFNYQGKDVGIIQIDEQARPIYLKRDYGRLKRDEVYVRRGSSTDPTKPASLDEVARMGSSTMPLQTDLEVEFADVEREVSLGTVVSWQAEYCQMPPRDKIPDLVAQSRTMGHFRLPSYDSLNPLNRSYFRQLAAYTFVERLYKPVRLLIRNISQAGARDVRVVFSITEQSRCRVLDAADVPEFPERHLDLLTPPGLAQIKRNGHGLGDVCIRKNGDVFSIEVDFGHIQPGREMVSDVFYLAVPRSGTVELHGEIFADNLTRPKSVSLKINAEIEQTKMTVEQLVRLGT